jgi:hypothetical protein
MAYSDFTLETATTAFGLTATDVPALFAAVAALEPSDWLRTSLTAAHLGRSMNTEKARSELMIAPFFTELWLRFRDRCSFFSGIDFTVDPGQGLRGYCDFILSRAPSTLILTAPVAMIAEAKNDNLPTGYGQCVAGMVGARLFNERRGSAVPTMFGAVSTGDVWQFLRLDGDHLSLDRDVYDVREPDRILGILYAMVA